MGSNETTETPVSQFVVPVPGGTVTVGFNGLVTLTAYDGRTSVYVADHLLTAGTPTLRYRGASS